MTATAGRGSQENPSRKSAATANRINRRGVTRGPGLRELYAQIRRLHQNGPTLFQAQAIDRLYRHQPSLEGTELAPNGRPTGKEIAVMLRAQSELLRLDAARARALCDPAAESNLDAESAQRLWAQAERAYDCAANRVFAANRDSLTAGEKVAWDDLRFILGYVACDEGRPLSQSRANAVEAFERETGRPPADPPAWVHKLAGQEMRAASRRLTAQAREFEKQIRRLDSTQPRNNIVAEWTRGGRDVGLIPRGTKPKGYQPMPADVNGMSYAEFRKRFGSR